VHLRIPRAFVRTLAPLLRGLRGGPPVLDLGCGSGLVTGRLARAGLRVVGVDRSEAMLRIARRRCARFGPRVRLVRGDLARLRLPPTAPLAVACGDVVNHLPTRAVVRRVLAAARRSLAPGGVLVFDAVSDFAFETYWPDNTHLLRGPRGDLLMDCDYDPLRRRGTVRMTAYARGARGAYTRHETTLHEYAWRDRELASAFCEAGYARAWRLPWSAWPDQHAEPAMDRTLWCGRAPGGPGAVSDAQLRALGFRRAR